MTQSLNTPGIKVLLTCKYGSWLYGTNTPTSDIDIKKVYLPTFNDVLLGKRHATFKLRVDAVGNHVSSNSVMPPDGVETEHVPLVTFCRDYFNGQTYALEIAQACAVQDDAGTWLKQLVKKFTTPSVNSMISFAKKQTFDYVHRGQRLEQARRAQAAMQVLVANDKDGIYEEFTGGKQLRLDHTIHGEKVLHTLARAAELELGSSVNAGKVMETLKLNGREYLETTAVGHLLEAVSKLVQSYGHRTQAAAETEVDRKSLMHAVRVYQQALELLETGRIAFPRPNVEELLRIKTTAPLEEVKQQLLELDAQAQEAEKASLVLQEKTAELEKQFDSWLLGVLRDVYDLKQ